MTYTPDTYSDYKASAKFTTTANITLSGLGTQAGGDWSASLTAGDRVLVKNQSTGSQNGIYEASSGSWVRTRDADQNFEITSGMMVSIEGGATLADTTWTVTTDGTITVGSTSITFAQISGGGSADLNPAYRRSWFGVG